MSTQPFSVKDIFSTTLRDHDILVNGWVRSVRKSKNCSFVILNDGSSFESLQIVADSELENFSEVSQLLIGSSIKVEGKIVDSAGKQPV